MKTGQRTKGRYQVKREAGLVPHIYDRDSKRFMAGAFKNWPGGKPNLRLVHADAEFLKRARENR